MKSIVILTLTLFFLYLHVYSQKPAADTSLQGGAQALADKLANPVANLISAPLQSNFDHGIGPYNGSKYTLNVQPVIPIQLSQKLNLITRYIFPIIDQHDVTGELTHQFGLSDATLSAFFAPADSKNGLIWGAGPAFLVPTGTNEFLTAGKWGIGPTGLLLKTTPGLVYGMLINQIWSFAGSKNRNDVNQMFLQPFFNHNWKSGAGIGFNAEITANWQAQTSFAYLNPVVSGVTKLGKQAVSLAVGPRIPLWGPSSTLADFGFRGVLTFVFPK